MKSFQFLRNPLFWIFSFSFLVSVGLFVAKFNQQTATSGLLLGDRRLHLPFEGSGNIGVVMIDGVIVESLPVLEELKEFADNPKIKAILVRIDSPGGAVGPSQEIYDEIRKIREKKVVIASLGSVAASGGYYVASAAQKIVSAPGTITGSIGVIMQLSNLEDLYKWIRIQPYVIKSGKFKDVGSPHRKMLPHEQELLQTLLDQTHLQFQKAVADSRSLPLEFIKTIADGRIMNGEMAKSYGLVDALGNFQDAVDLAANLSQVSDPRLVYPPDHKWGRLRGLFGAVFGVAKRSLQRLSLLPQDYMPSFQWDAGS